MKTRANQQMQNPTQTRQAARSVSGFPRRPPIIANLRLSICNFQFAFGCASAPSRRCVPSPIRHPRGIALVITLLMLSVITFLAVTFLVLTRTHQDQVTATVDQATAQDMSRAALARAQSQIIARMKAHTNILNYDYMAPHNFINPLGFVSGGTNVNNVNYDYYSTGAPMSPAANGGGDWAQNIANLWLDPRPPVFIKVGTNTDFRFWLDLNRNKKFETNGYLPVMQDNGLPLTNINGVAVTNYFNGEPEWIGVLQYPEWPHSATNRFVGRYTYVVLPIGKTLDFNFIHNYSKVFVTGVWRPPPAPPVPMLAAGATPVDLFIRDQGVGSWELNLAGCLWALDTNIYAGNYYYSEAVNRNSGSAFDDAYSFLRFRYNGVYGGPYPWSLASFFAPYTPNYTQDGIDEYGIMGLLSPQYYPSVTAPWPGGYTTNNFYGIQDVFDPNKTSPYFTNRLLTAGSYTNSYDRYMFQRLLAGIGSGSAPELQTWVYADGITTNPVLQPPTLLRTKVNINYDNSYQIANGLNTSPTALIPWTEETNGALGFFTNAAESLLRSQNFRVTNYDIYGNVILTNPFSYNHFGLTNIPIYSSTNPSIRYSEQIHRMLQLAANIYDATRTDTVVPAGSLPHPSVFRPLFRAVNYGGTNHALFIIGYTNVTTDAAARVAVMSLQGLKLPSDPSITNNDNVWGIPWVIGAVKGLPAFDRFAADTTWLVTRKLLFVRQNPTTVQTPAGNITYIGDPTKPPAYTNQFLIMSITNTFGMDAWNAYQSNITYPCEVIASTVVSIVLTNNSIQYPGGFVTNFILTNNAPISFWGGVGQVNAERTTNGMLAFLQTNIASLRPVYFSESEAAAGAPNPFVPVYGTTNSYGFPYNIGTFLPGDLAQTYPWQIYNWTLSVTNQVMYALVDNSGGPNSGKAFDFVNLGPFGTTYVLTNLMFSGLIATTTPVANSGSSTPFTSYWNPAPGGTGLPSIGVLNQISNGIIHDPYFASELRPTNLNPIVLNSNLYFSCSNDIAATFPPQQPPAMFAQTLLVNDPLVHYTVGDLSPPGGDDSQILNYNDRYEPWPYNNTDAQQQTIGANMTFKDPQITRSDLWNFPANEFPGVGWLGRVHRGTPWQTIFLKADPNPVSLTGVPLNQQEWTANWVSTADTYPTNDYVLLDLFTAAPNDNAARGLLSVNQTNNAPWYAVFAGLPVNTNIPLPNSVGPPIGNNLVLDPISIAPLLDGLFLTNYNANNVPVVNYIAGITATRAAEADQVFHNLAGVFKSPILTIASPFLPGPAGNFKDEEVEAIPQQVAGLLKLGQPQFVIYGYGQALKPKDIYFGAGPNFNLVTNYQITGEFVTRAVCHVVGDPAAASVKIQVDSFNILPAD